MVDENIKWFRELTNEDVAIAGGKGASLGEMYNSKLPIPPGFVVTAQAFKKYIEKTRLKNKIMEKLSKVDIEDTQKLQTISQEVQDLILQTEILHEIQKDIIEAYDNLNVNSELHGVSKNALNIIKTGRDAPFVAVRSSATAEDLPSISKDEHIIIKINNKIYFKSMEEIYDLVGEGEGYEIEIPAMKENKIQWCKVSNLYKHKVKNEERLYDIITETGKRIVVSPTHTLLILDENDLTIKEVKNIKELKGNEKLPTLADFKEEKELNPIIKWDKIEEVKEIKYNDFVYDFTVPEVENFAASGIITHNSASFAGQQASFLNIKGNQNLIKAVQMCWASLYTARAIYYRIKNNFPHDKVYIAVVIQKMVNSEKAGVMFSVNPATNNESEIVIEAAFGLGDAVVAGEVSPDNYILDKNNLILKHKIVNKQEWMYARDNLKNIKKELGEKGKEQKLNESEIKRLGELAQMIEKHYKRAMDMEFAIEGSKVYIVQARPVTTLKKEKKEDTTKELGNIILEGLGASPGIAGGKVKIITNMKEISKIEKGDVLVAKMTSPDYVPAMEKASAIVTDEGGLTCFGGETIVLTNKGFKKIEEISEILEYEKNLFIFSYDYINCKPKWKKILSAGKRKRFAINVSVSQTNRILHNTIRITPDHKIYTYKNRELVKKEINKVIEEQEGICLLEKLPDFVIEKSEPKLAYLLGALLSDGHCKISSGKSGLPRRGIVIFTQKETENKKLFINTVRTYFNDIFNENFSLIREKETNSLFNGHVISGFATDFICCKMEPARQILKISQDLDYWLIKYDKETAFNFLAGLIDGDGCYYDNRLHIYVSKENVLKGVIVACLKLGIVPQITVNRNIHHVQIVEKVSDVLNYTKRVDGMTRNRIGTKFFAAKQIIADIVDEVNWKGKIKPYVQKNLLLDKNKIVERIMPLASSKIREELQRVVDSNLRMQRITYVEDIGMIDVFNIQVKANNDMDHNYVVFTKKYSSLLVSNSHAAIVSRELEVPCVVGTEKATKILKENDLITVDGNTGKVYEGYTGKIEKKESINKEYIHEPIITATKLYMNLGEPEKIDEYKDLDFDGIGLMRVEFIITSYINEHPNAMIRDGREKEYIEKLAKGIETVASAINNKPMIVRFSDFKTNEYKNLKGGENYEPHEENPMLGWRGVSRYVSEEFKGAFELEIKAILKVRAKGLKNVHVMLPFVRNIDEVEQCLKILKENDLENSHDFNIYLMAEVPSIALLAEEFASLKIAGCSIGSNDLTQLVLGVDRDSTKLAKMGYFDERNMAVLKAIDLIIKGFKKHNKTVSICGQAPSVYPEIVEFLVKSGIDAISVNPDTVNKTRVKIASTERKILLEKLRD